MPVYEYRCQSCGKVFELKQRFSDEPLKVHEECGGPVERLISPPALVFKGTGWYITDYARGSGGGNGSPKKHSEGSTKTAEKLEKAVDAAKSADKNSAASTGSKSS